jgi:hypothetical protein
MKIEKHYSLQAADIVLAMLYHMADEDVNVDVTVSAWSNGREQGYHLAAYDRDNRQAKPKALVFAQQRNSDQVLVVYGNQTDFDVTTNMPTEDIWHNSRKDFTAYQDAAEFILTYLMGNAT